MSDLPGGIELIPTAANSAAPTDVDLDPPGGRWRAQKRKSAPAGTLPRAPGSDIPRDLYTPDQGCVRPIMVSIGAPRSTLRTPLVRSGGYAMVLSDSDVRALPKVELHCHIEGTMRAATVAELALTADVRMPVDDPSDLYQPSYASLTDFLSVFWLVQSVLVDQTPGSGSRSRASSTVRSTD
ncbi:MAG: hypothetical protein ABIP17_02620 [Ilumatobacteraceae bacterium]